MTDPVELLQAGLTDALALMARVRCTQLKLGLPSEPCEWCLEQERLRNLLTGVTASVTQ